MVPEDKPKINLSKFEDIDFALLYAPTLAMTANSLLWGKNIKRFTRWFHKKAKNQVMQEQPLDLGEKLETLDTMLAATEQRSIVKPAITTAIKYSLIALTAYYIGCAVGGRIR